MFSYTLFDTVLTSGVSTTIVDSRSGEPIHRGGCQAHGCHSDIRTTVNIYGDVVTDEMTTASSRVAQLAFQTNGAQTERKES